MRQSTTISVELNIERPRECSAEPYEGAWVFEAIYFIRALEVEGIDGGSSALVKAMHWCDRGTLLPLPAAHGITSVRVSHFGGWLRLVGALPDGARMKVVAHLVLKE